jgi:hypothetical protein
MTSTQPTHTVSKRGGDCRIQFIFKLVEQFTLTTNISWFYKMRGIVNSSSTVNPSTTSNPRKYIMRFLKLRTRFVNLHPRIDNSFHWPERRIRVKKSTRNTQRR